MAAPQLLTYSDIIDHLEDFLQGYGVGAPQSAIRTAVLEAYEEIAAAHDWSFLTKSWRVQLQAAQTTGTVAFDLTGGTYERQLTMASATWPSDAVDWAIIFDDILCDIEERKSSTVVTLDATMSPGADVAATSFTLFPRWYALPAGFMALARPLEETAAWQSIRPVSLDEMMALMRYSGDSAGDIQYYAIGPAEDLYGSMAIYVWPPSDAAETLDGVGKFRPRDLVYSGRATADTAGTIAVTSGSATVTGTGTSFASGMAGSLLRISSSSTAPTGRAGTNPWVEQRVISSVASATSLTLDAAVSTTRSAVKCRISDPVDLDISVHALFKRMCEAKLASLRNIEGAAQIYKVAQDALFAAKCADGRIRQRQVAWTNLGSGGRLADSTNRPALVE